MESKEEIWQKMMSGEVYDASHPALLEKLVATRKKIYEFNLIAPDKTDEMKKALLSILGKTGRNFHFNQPFRCDYGENISIGENFFANFNLTILDETEVRFGDNVFIGPNVSIYTACHPLETEPRNELLEWSEPVIVGNNVWIGGGVTILPGVTIGNNVVVGAGSVVTKSCPDNVVIAGNPAVIIKSIS